MAKTAVIQTRVDPAIKQKAQHVLEKSDEEESSLLICFVLLILIITAGH